MVRAFKLGINENRQFGGLRENAIFVFRKGVCMTIFYLPPPFTLLWLQFSLFFHKYILQTHLKGLAI